MKKLNVLFLFIYFLVSLFLFVAFNAQATESPAPVTQSERIEQITKRIEEIKEMDKSKLTKAQRMALRKEVRGMKNELRTSKMEAAGGYVYVSVGALIIALIIILLLL